MVPIYNVEPYLRRCIDSIVNQSYQEIEIILVNDGSKDNSLNICKEYQKIDSRIVVVDKKNGGLGSARNAGIDIATGEYMMFIDSDDYISINMTERLLQVLVQQDADIVACDFCCFYENGKIENKKNNAFIKCYSPTEALASMFRNDEIRWGAWNKIYKRKLFDNIRYAEGVYSEDMATTYLLYEKSKKIVWTNECLYYYYVRSNGIMKSKPPKRYADEVMIIENLCEHYSRKYPSLLKYPQAFWGKIALNNMIGLIDSKEYVDIYEKCVNAFLQYGKLALQADFVRGKFKIIILIFFIPMKLTNGKFAYSTAFKRIGRKVSFYLK